MSEARGLPARFGLRRRPQVELPVVAAHQIPGRVLELVRSEEGETELAADCIRSLVFHRWIRVQGIVLSLLPRELDRQCGRATGDAAALEFGQHRPTRLVHLLPQPLALPESEPAERLAGLDVDDLEHPRPRLGVAAMTLLELLRALRPAEVLGHRRVAHQPLDEPEVIVAK